ncbi:MAG: hypothetical protein R3B96_11850 [Pirellulaceae bacterium]
MVIASSPEGLRCPQQARREVGFHADQLEEQTPASNPRSFSLAALLLLMTVAAVLAAGGSYFWWATRGQNLSAVGFFGITQRSARRGDHALTLKLSASSRARRERRQSTLLRLAPHGSTVRLARTPNGSDHFSGHELFWGNSWKHEPACGSLHGDCL